MDAFQERLLAELPNATWVSHDPLAGRRWRCFSHGVCARCLLRRVLLDIDGSVVRWRRDEPAVDSCARNIRALGEDHAAWLVATPPYRYGVDCLGWLGVTCEFLKEGNDCVDNTVNTVNTVNADMSEFWNGEGARKWLRFQDRMDVILLPFGHEAMVASEISTNNFVLDIGCGCGDTSLEIGRRVGKHGRVHGLDISGPMIKEARSRESLAGQKNVTFDCSDAQTHQFHPVYDVVFSRFGVMFFEDPMAAFSNIRCAIKPGGRLVFICWQPAKDNEWVSRSLDIVANHIMLPEPPGPEDPGPMSFGDANRINRILTNTGFSDIRIEGRNTPFTVGVNTEEAVEFLTQLGPAGGAIANSDANEETKFRIVSDMRVALESYETDQGITLGSATWVVTAQNP